MEYCIALIKTLLTLFNLAFIWGLFYSSFLAKLDTTVDKQSYSLICFLSAIGFAGNIICLWLT